MLSDVSKDTVLALKASKAMEVRRFSFEAGNNKSKTIMESSMLKNVLEIAY